MRKLMPLAIVGIAANAHADFKEAIQMSPKAHKQIEFADTESANGRTFTGAYKVKDGGLFAAISGGNKTFGMELGPYWKKNNWHALVTGKPSMSYEGAPSLTIAARTTGLYKHFLLDVGGFYTAKDGLDVRSLRVTPGLILGHVTVGIEYSAINEKKPSTNAIGRYDGNNRWHVVASYGKDQKDKPVITAKFRKDFK